MDFSKNCYFLTTLALQIIRHTRIDPLLSSISVTCSRISKSRISISQTHHVWWQVIFFFFSFFDWLVIGPIYTDHKFYKWAWSNIHFSLAVMTGRLCQNWLKKIKMSKQMNGEYCKKIIFCDLIPLHEVGVGNNHFEVLVLLSFFTKAAILQGWHHP